MTAGRRQYSNTYVVAIQFKKASIKENQIKSNAVMNLSRGAAAAARLRAVRTYLRARAGTDATCHAGGRGAS